MDHDVNAVQASLPGDAAWRKSSYSSPSGNCVEAAKLTGGVALRNSRFPDGPALVFASAAVGCVPSWREKGMLRLIGPRLGGSRHWLDRDGLSEKDGPLAS